MASRKLITAIVSLFVFFGRFPEGFAISYRPAEPQGKGLYQTWMVSFGQLPDHTRVSRTLLNQNAGGFMRLLPTSPNGTRINDLGLNELMRGILLLFVCNIADVLLFE